MQIHSIARVAVHLTHEPARSICSNGNARNIERPVRKQGTKEGRREEGRTTDERTKEVDTDRRRTSIIKDPSLHRAFKKNEINENTPELVPDFLKNRAYWQIMLLQICIFDPFGHSTIAYPSHTDRHTKRGRERERERERTKMVREIRE